MCCRPDFNDSVALKGAINFVVLDGGFNRIEIGDTKFFKEFEFFWKALLAISNTVSQ